MYANEPLSDQPGPLAAISLSAVYLPVIMTTAVWRSEAKNGTINTDQLLMQLAVTPLGDHLTRHCCRCVHLFRGNATALTRAQSASTYRHIKRYSTTVTQAYLYNWLIGSTYSLNFTTLCSYKFQSRKLIFSHTCCVDRITLSDRFPTNQKAISLVGKTETSAVVCTSWGRTREASRDFVLR